MKAEFEGVRAQALEAKMSSTSSTVTYEVQEHSSLLSQLNVNVAALQNQLRALTSNFEEVKAKQEELDHEKPQFTAASAASNRMLGRIQTKLEDTAAALAAGAQVGASTQVNERIAQLEAEVAKLKSSHQSIQSTVVDSASNYETMVAAMREATSQASSARSNVNKALAEAAKASDEVSQVLGTVRMIQNDSGQRDLLINTLQQQISSYHIEMGQVRDRVTSLGSSSNYDMQLLTMKESIAGLRQVTDSLWLPLLTLT